ncbi:MAG: ATP:cob(I)alamin adenosyltransferase [Treponema sp.]|nr:ATP:cob(I)alamin adenosyltransferase [Treponema sp.]MCL2237429.1 ATP:cob(I)alamin adenosyltransferase [Treponema sp.]
MSYNAETTNLNGFKTSKNDDLIHFIGTADELNAYLGLVRAMIANEDAWQVSWHRSVQFIERIQKNMMKMMSHVSDSRNEKFFFSVNDVTDMENEINRLQGALPKQYKFNVPGKNIIEAQIQIARTIARRAERMYAAIYEEKTLCPNAGAYLNRLSDYLYFLSQQESLINVNFINQIAGI